MGLKKPQMWFFCDPVTSHVWHLFPLFSPKEELQAELAQTVPEIGANDDDLQQDDFVVNVSAFYFSLLFNPEYSLIAPQSTKLLNQS